MNLIAFNVMIASLLSTKPPSLLIFFAHFAKTLQNCLLNPQNRLFPHTPTVNSQWISRHPQADNVRTFTPAPL